MQRAISALTVFCIGKLEKSNNYHSRSYRLAFILNQNESKCKNKIYKLAKVNDRIQIIHLAISRNKRNRNMIRERWLDGKMAFRVAIKWLLG